MENAHFRGMEETESKNDLAKNTEDGRLGKIVMRGQIALKILRVRVLKNNAEFFGRFHEGADVVDDVWMVKLAHDFDFTLSSFESDVARLAEGNRFDGNVLAGLAVSCKIDHAVAALPDLFHLRIPVHEVYVCF
jgi:hypothetical protein